MKYETLRSVGLGMDQWKLLTSYLVFPQSCVKSNCDEASVSHLETDWDCRHVGWAFIGQKASVALYESVYRFQFLS